MYFLLPLRAGTKEAQVIGGLDQIQWGGIKALRLGVGGVRQARALYAVRRRVRA